MRSGASTLHTVRPPPGHEQDHSPGKCLTEYKAPESPLTTASTCRPSTWLTTTRPAASSLSAVLDAWTVASLQQVAELLVTKNRRR
jgi:hypothetical protein